MIGNVFEYFFSAAHRSLQRARHLGTYDASGGVIASLLRGANTISASLALSFNFSFPLSLDLSFRFFFSCFFFFLLLFPLRRPFSLSASLSLCFFFVVSFGRSLLRL